MDTCGASAEPVGGFQRLGDLVVRRPLWVIGFWVALAAVLSLTLPSLAQMVRERPVDILPPDSPALVTAKHMTGAFHESGSDNILVVVLTNERGLGRADEDVYRSLVDKLRKDSADIVMVQDFISTPPLRDAMTSKDQKAWYLPLGLAGQLGSPKSYDAYTRVAAMAKNTAAGSTLTAHLTGPSATVADLTDVSNRDLHLIEIATAIMVLTILLVVYRNPVAMMLPLITIAISLVVAQDIVAGLARLGLGITNQTIVFMTGMMVGAGTD
jgi:RND superfamily putative drug exporter